MKDVGSYHFVKAGNHNVLIPQPSDDEDDPLNWSLFWKNAAIFLRDYALLQPQSRAVGSGTHV